MMRRDAALAVVVGVGLLAAGCSSSGSSPSSANAPTPTPMPSATTLPTVTEAFTLLPCPRHSPVSTLDLEGCAEHRITRLDGQINAAATALYNGLSLASAKRDFATAQQAWVTYRRAACLSESDAYGSGTLAPVSFANCEVRIDQQRLSDLKLLRRESNP